MCIRDSQCLQCLQCLQFRLIYTLYLPEKAGKVLSFKCFKTWAVPPARLCPSSRLPSFLHHFHHSGYWTLNAASLDQICKVLHSLYWTIIHQQFITTAGDANNDSQHTNWAQHPKLNPNRRMRKTTFIALQSQVKSQFGWKVSFPLTALQEII